MGRKKSNNFKVKDPQTAVSGEHCIIYRKDGDFYIQDIGSQNGTYIGI